MKRISAAMVKCLGMVAAGWVLLAEEPVSDATRPPIASFNKASSALGMVVKDDKGKEVAKIRELVIDFDAQKIGYALLAITSSPERLVPVPVSALRPVRDHFVLNMTPAVLAAAPSVANDVWPALDSFAVGSPASSEKGQGSSSTAK